MKRLLIIGAGPIGLAAALGGMQRGWDVTVLEQGEAGASLRRWGPTKFFSPLSMNLPPGVPCSLPGDAILTGAEFADAVLVPIADRVKTGHRVIAVTRAGLTKADFARHPIRAERAFRVLAETPDGEKVFEADAVIDASGVYGQPVPLAVPGERALAGSIRRDLASIDDLEGQSVLLVGHGHSAANAILRLSHASRVIWATRSLNRRPCVEVACDPLPERRRIVAEANQLAMQPPAWLHVERRASVDAIAEAGEGKVRVSLSGGREAVVDVVLALTGYRPDLSFLSELAIGIDPVTEGAAGLTRALSNITDCLAVPTVSPEDLDSGEPGFYLAGAKSYGRSRSFLLQNGYAQLDTILERLNG